MIESKRSLWNKDNLQEHKTYFIEERYEWHLIKKIVEISIVSVYSFIKAILKLCHNALKCIGIKYINIISDGRLQVSSESGGFL